MFGRHESSVVAHLVWQRTRVNPYTIPLMVVPAAITIYAAFVPRRWVRISLLLAATVVFWFVLPLHVHWTYSHPFDPNDGGPKAFALVFGWVVGLVFVVIPVYVVSRATRWIGQRLHKKFRVGRAPVDE